MDGKKGSTSVRSIRMPDELIAALEKESEAQHLSVNTIANTVIFRYLDWEKYAERFGFMTVTRETFVALISRLEEEELSDLAKSVSVSILKEFALYSWEIKGLKSFLDFIQKFARYARIGEWEVRNEGPFYKASLLHRMGPKVSVYLCELYSGLLRQITGFEAEGEVLENGFILKFTVS
jgi:hypothetical protein